MVSFPFTPPPPLKQHAQEIDHVSFLVQSSHASKILKTTIHEPMSSKGKKEVTHSNSYENASQLVTSHTQKINESYPYLSEIHPQVSNQPLTQKDHSTNQEGRATGSEKRQTASHNKYGF